MKHLNLAITGAFSLLSLTSAFGCGDDSGSSSGSGVDSKKLISEVTDADAQKFCRWIEKESAGINPTVKQACTAGAIALSSDEESCNAFVDQCVQAGENTEDPGETETSDCSTVEVDETSKSCEVTVGQYEACAKALLNSFKQQITGASCADAGKPSDGGSVVPAACEELEEKCPAVYDDLGGSEADDGDGPGGETGEFNCGTGEFVLNSWVCDGDADCSNGKDEENCE